MASTTFVNGVTVTDEDWFNDLNRLHYTIFADAANVAAARTALGLGTADTPAFGGATYGTNAGTTVTVTLNAAATTAAAYHKYQEAGVNKWGSGRGVSDGGSQYEIYNFGTTSSPVSINLTTNKVTILASAAGGATFNIPQGTAPTAPVNGDIWMTSAGLYYRANGATVGPLT